MSSIFMITETELHEEGYLHGVYTDLEKAVANAANIKKGFPTNELVIEERLLNTPFRYGFSGSANEPYGGIVAVYDAQGNIKEDYRKAVAESLGLG